MAPASPISTTATLLRRSVVVSASNRFRGGLGVKNSHGLQTSHSSKTSRRGPLNCRSLVCAGHDKGDGADPIEGLIGRVTLPESLPGILSGSDCGIRWNRRPGTCVQPIQAPGP